MTKIQLLKGIFIIDQIEILHQSIITLSNVVDYDTMPLIIIAEEKVRLLQLEFKNI